MKIAGGNHAKKDRFAKLDALKEKAKTIKPAHSQRRRRPAAGRSLPLQEESIERYSR